MINIVFEKKNQFFPLIWHSIKKKSLLNFYLNIYNLELNYCLNHKNFDLFGFVFYSNHYKNFV